MSSDLDTITVENLSQGQRERLAFIDFKTFFCGEVRRADLEARFGIAPAAATRDLTTYRTLRSSNLVYDPSAKIYTMGSLFSPVFNMSSKRVLAWLRQGFGDGISSNDRPLVASDSAIPLVPPPLNMLGAVSRAIHQHNALNITYLSVISGPSQRTIVPVALVDNGLRWHVRAFDRKNQRFGDFVVNRISKSVTVTESIAENEKIEADHQWNRMVDVELVPHPGLRYPEAVQADYCMVHGFLYIQCRAAVVGYALHRWQVDCSADHSLSPIEHHLWLRNANVLNEVENAILAPGWKESS